MINTSNLHTNIPHPILHHNVPVVVGQAVVVATIDHKLTHKSFYAYYVIFYDSYHAYGGQVLYKSISKIIL